jgi:uncharacterized repeat protein (TIGR03803 family)
LHAIGIHAADQGSTMMVSKRLLSTTLLAAGAAFALLPAQVSAKEHKETVLQRFLGTPDGEEPTAGLIADAKGNLYGTTVVGGTGHLGTVFKLAPHGKETVLHSFEGGEDGVWPRGSLLLDAQGDLYGTSSSGVEGVNHGAVFKITPDGKLTVLYQFAGGFDGASPIGGLISDADGNLYGTTAGGGVGCDGNGCGTVFKVTPKGKETVLHAFTGGNDGAEPAGELVADADGNLYGTTQQGGSVACDGDGCGTVFKLTPAGQETVLYAFPSGGHSGVWPQGHLVIDAEGNLYGTTREGGDYHAWCSGGCGTVFKLAPDGKETVLYAFAGGSDGFVPVGGVIADGNGNLYGTTLGGGSSNCSSGCGTVFKVTPEGKERLLYTFTGGDDGMHPFAGLLADTKGNLYGTTERGGGAGCNGQGCGTVFKVKN